MSRQFVYLFSILIFAASCSKKSDSQKTTSCGTPGWPQGNWKVKCVVTGQDKPDSVTFDINRGQTQYGTYYYKQFSTPSLPLADSIDFCGDVNSDINIRLYSADTTKTFYLSIFVNNILVRQDTARTFTDNRWTGNGAQCK